MWVRFIELDTGNWEKNEWNSKYNDKNEQNSNESKRNLKNLKNQIEIEIKWVEDNWIEWEWERNWNWNWKMT